MALLPPFFLDCVVALGVRNQDGTFSWVASGFLYGRYTHTVGEEKWYNTYLITNRHVFEGHSLLMARFNPEADEAAREFSVTLRDPDNSRQRWFAHPDSEVDVAGIAVNLDILRANGIRSAFFANDEHTAPIARMTESGVSEGDQTFILGFPMGLVGTRRSAVVVRSGPIARLRDVLDGTEKSFLVDSFIFPGNSGGPVILAPEMVSIEGTQAHNRADLIGMVRAYLPYRDVAISKQSGRPRVVFEENSGLCEVHPVDMVDQAIAAYEAQRQAQVVQGTTPEGTTEPAPEPARRTAP